MVMSFVDPQIVHDARPVQSVPREALWQPSSRVRELPLTDFERDRERPSRPDPQNDFLIAENARFLGVSRGFPLLVEL